MIDAMPFGSRRAVGWIPCPTSGFEHGIVRRSTTQDRSDGPPGYRTSRQPYRTFNFSWNAPYEKLHTIEDAFLYTDGPPLYFTQPRALMDPTFNLMPPHWAAPGRYIANFGDDAARGTYGFCTSGFGSVAPVATEGVPGDASFPTKYISIASPNNAELGFVDYNVFDGGAAPFVFTSDIVLGTIYSARNPSATIIVPPGYGAILRVAAGGSNLPISLAVVSSVDGLFDSIPASATHTIQPNSTPSVKSLSLDLSGANAWHRIDIGIGKTTINGIGTLNLFGMAFYIQRGLVPSTSDWSRGRGQMPVFPTNDLSVTTYQAYDPQRTAMSVNLSEGYIPW